MQGTFSASEIRLRIQYETRSFVVLETFINLKPLLFMNKYLTLLFLFIALNAFSQSITIGGNVQDTAAKAPLQYAVATVLKLDDSLLVSFARADAKGFFSMKNIPMGNYQVIISHPKFGDLSFYVFGSPANFAFDFGKIILPPKSHTLNEIVIYAYKDPVYYKGDTMIYTADSFKVKPNATVEDLLKKLPGIKVDKDGKITAQGTKVDQVLVDGDEFFGTDPTMATKNLNANTVESVQVYDKKNENPSDNGSDETIKVMNLKLKEDSKKGYFGKTSGAGDFQKFYEGELLLNKFRKKQKISVFSLGSNTPNSGFGWGDAYKYGLDNETPQWTQDDNGTWNPPPGGQGPGIPQTFKSGIYYTDKISKNTKLGFNYTYNNNQLKSNTSTRSQYFQSDTSYTTTNTSESQQKNEGHNINFSIDQTIDSLTELTILPKLNFNTRSQQTFDVTDFIAKNDTMTRKTNVENINTTKAYDVNTNFRLSRRFKKKDRLLIATYDYAANGSESSGILKSSNVFYNGLPLNDSINQKKQNSITNQSQTASVVYTEPITKKIKLEFAYDFFYNLGLQDKKTLNFSNGDYTVENNLLTNNFENKRFTNRLGAKFIYEVKKQRLTMGTRARQILVSNTNLLTNERITQKTNNVLPYLSYMYKFSDNKRFNMGYATSSVQPTINQLQPIPDNTNPNQIKIGNPNLIPTFQNNFNMSFNSYKAITGKYIWASMNFNTINNAIVNSIVYDSIGRGISQAVNVNGNYNGRAGISGGIPFFSKVLQLDPDLNFNYTSYSNFINKQKNTTKNASTDAGLDIVITLDTLDFRVGGSYTYNNPSTTLNPQSSKPYSTQVYNASTGIKLPKKFRLESDVVYTINSRRTAGFNISYFLWNASLSKTFFKSEALIVSILAYDILNQNINTNRSVQDNIIIDTKTNIISRYILLKAVYKFNSNKTKEDEEDF